MAIYREVYKFILGTMNQEQRIKINELELLIYEVMDKIEHLSHAMAILTLSKILQTISTEMINLESNE